MITLTYRVRCPRCGQKFYAKGTVYWQMATKCLHCGQKKYADVGAPTKSDGIGR
jgi:predicted  nucleic acid-binding Zn-ribbon protein